jgi:hypothetical protein
MDDKELFSSAMAPDAPPQEEAPKEAPADQVDETPPETEEQPRDERGRFAARQEETPAEPQAPAQAEAPPAEPQQPKDDDGQVPSWRLRELREARDTEARRASEVERELAVTRHYLQQVQRELHGLKNPQQGPDVFENPKGFLEHGLGQAIDPVKSEIGQMREFFSRKDAVREYGAEAVNAAYNAMGQALNAGDPEANAAYRQAMSSMDPYYGIMRWHMQRSVIAEAGYDLNAWFEKQLEQRLSDKAFSAKVLGRIQGTAPAADQEGRPNIDLPPSLNKITGAGVRDVPTKDDGDMSDKSLFRFAVATNRR